MRRIIQLIFVLLILSGCASKTTIIETPTTQPSEIIKFGKSQKTIKNDITVVYLSGSPYEIGFAHGKLCKEEILQAHQRRKKGQTYTFDKSNKSAKSFFDKTSLM